MCCLIFFRSFKPQSVVGRERIIGTFFERFRRFGMLHRVYNHFAGNLFVCPDRKSCGIADVFPLKIVFMIRFAYPFGFGTFFPLHIGIYCTHGLGIADRFFRIKNNQHCIIVIIKMELPAVSTIKLFYCSGIGRFDCWRFVVDCYTYRVFF